jgi:hypothetical protein
MTTTINGTTGVSQVQDSVVTDGKLSLTANSAPIKTALNASGSAPIYACRAWVNFNGAGTVAIRASGNVSSITDNGVGDYTVNFTTAMSDVNYGAAGIASVDTSKDPVSLYTITTSSVRLVTGALTNPQTDKTTVSVQVFR